MLAVLKHAGRNAFLGALLAAGILVPSAGSVQAAGCQQATLSRANGAEVARLRRQINANMAFAAKYNCLQGKPAFACREIFGRVAEAETRLASLAPQKPSACPQKSLAGRAPVRRATVVKAVIQQPPARIETMCVRPSDGYYFPTPNSGYSTAGDIEKIAVQCRFICEDPGMDVYRKTGEDGDPNGMISLTSGQRYAELSTAGDYRTAIRAKACDMSRFYKHALERTTAVQTENTAADETAPNQPPVMAMNEPLLMNVGLRGTTSVVPARPRKVRIIGALYLPADE